MEYMGGTKLPSGEGRLLELALFTGGSTGAESVGTDSTFESFESPGNDSFIGGLDTNGSGMNEEADDLSERRLLVRAPDLSDGSELADETEGDSLATSGDEAYDNGDCRWSIAKFGEAFA
jgi:hypothetical protein